MVGGIADEVLELRMVGRFKGLELEVVGAPRYRRHDRRPHAGASRSDGARQLGCCLPLLVLVRDDPGMTAYPDAISRIVELLNLGSSIHRRRYRNRRARPHRHLDRCNPRAVAAGRAYFQPGHTRYGPNSVRRPGPPRPVRMNVWQFPGRPSPCPRIRTARRLTMETGMAISRQMRLRSWSARRSTADLSP